MPVVLVYGYEGTVSFPFLVWMPPSSQPTHPLPTVLLSRFPSHHKLHTYQRTLSRHVNTIHN